MARGYLPEKGSSSAPCENACRHRDCEETRQMLAAKCPICHQQFTYGDAIYISPRGIVHALCEEACVRGD